MNGDPGLELLNPTRWREVLEDASSRTLRFVAGARHIMPERTTCADHAHYAAEIVYHPRGVGRTRVNRMVTQFSAGDIVVYAPREIHDQHAEEECEDVCIQVALPPAAARRLRYGFLLGGVEGDWLVEEIEALSRSYGDGSALDQRVLDLRVTAVLLALVKRACEASESLRISTTERYVRKAEQYVREHFADIASLRQIADHVGLSESHLRHLFRSARKRSLVGYLREVRLNRAKVLLATSPHGLKQIAGMCGFTDEYYFSAVFRKVVGTPPGQYRLRQNPAQELAAASPA
ncbi:AraC-type DNA-binding protein [Terrimicrobium sacchariphilum]|uniref:AraC-type DNA-binding protein n=1 Tax=Terrimicrobium sacchariphilum TaxID=690879 RepID=A0A146GD63_TERSA|nr:AraC family transcriptional regulator [Terrimicrobium sacchariphilum]GAT35291.1 AraC-type DNA-binding protein [Terrimicrobium sacchariphilum]